jgi:nucleoside-diphosphate-sugar epimerase
MGTYLVTGGGGFIGSHIAEKLVGEGQDVRILDDFSTGRRENIASFLSDVTLIEGDIRDPEVVNDAVSGVDYVIHQAALASVPRSIEDPVTSNQVNVGGTLHLLVASKEHGVKRFVYASSSSIYGDSDKLPKSEEMNPNPKSPYAISKLAGEYYCGVFGEVYGMPTVSLRYFNVFGPRQDPNSQYAAVIPIFIKALLDGEAPTIFGDGEQTRDFTYIDNVVSGNLLAARSNVPGASVYNLACGGRFSLNYLYGRLKDYLNVSVEPKFAPPRPGDVKHSQADIGAAERDLGFTVTDGLDDGLERTIEWYKKGL